MRRNRTWDAPRHERISIVARLPHWSRKGYSESAQFAHLPTWARYEKSAEDTATDRQSGPVQCQTHAVVSEAPWA